MHQNQVDLIFYNQSISVLLQLALADLMHIKYLGCFQSTGILFACFIFCFVIN